MKQNKKCPKCNGAISDRWCVGRKLQYFCQNEDCDWEAAPRMPSKRKITNTKTCILHSFSGWDYIIYDKYGHTMVVSRTYNTPKEAMIEMGRVLLQGEKDVCCGPYTAVLFHTPVQVTITGEMFKVKKGKVKRT